MTAKGEMSSYMIEILRDWLSRDDGDSTDSGGVYTTPIGWKTFQIVLMRFLFTRENRHAVKSKRLHLLV